MKLEQTFFIGAHDVDNDKKVTMKKLLEMLSDISMLHGARSGQTSTEGVSPISWIVLGWYMQVYSRPAMFSTLRVETWIRDYSRVRANRDYVIYDENNVVVAKATAEWAAKDVATGRFLRITPELLAPFDPEPEQINFPDYSFPTVRRFDPTVVMQQEMEINRLMFDYNGHVHNSIYVNLAEQVLPENLYRHRFSSLEIIYNLEITSEGNVLLEYTPGDHEHIVAVRRKPDRKLHAVVKFFE